MVVLLVIYSHIEEYKIKAINRELLKRICDSLPADPDDHRTVCLNYEWLYEQIEDLCVPKAQPPALKAGWRYVPIVNNNDFSGRGAVDIETIKVLLAKNREVIIATGRDLVLNMYKTQ